MADARVHRTAEVSAEAAIGDGTAVWHWAQIREGAHVGKRCNIGKDVSPHALVAGVPAKRIGWVCECGRPLDTRMRCAHDGRTYPDLKPKRKARSRRRK